MTHQTLMPREKLKLRGPQALSDDELLRALIGSGNQRADVGEIASSVYKLLKREGPSFTYEHLENITGIGQAHICELLASFELGRRYLVESELPVIDSTEAAVAQLGEIRCKKQEHFVCLTLDGANRLIANRTVTIGTLTSSLVHPREVFADAITDRAASIIVAHNHPSGSLSASDADRQVTSRLKETSDLIGIKLLDHIIVTKASYCTIPFNL